MIQPSLLNSRAAGESFCVVLTPRFVIIFFSFFFYSRCYSSKRKWIHLPGSESNMERVYRQTCQAHGLLTSPCFALSPRSCPAPRRAGPAQQPCTTSFHVRERNSVSPGAPLRGLVPGRWALALTDPMAQDTAPKLPSEPHRRKQRRAGENTRSAAVQRSWREEGWGP